MSSSDRPDSGAHPGPGRTGHAGLYALALRAYPPDHRATYGAEILATVLEATGPDRRWPSLREAVALVAGGCVTRVRRAADGPSWWADGLHLGIVLVALGDSMTDLAGPYPYWRAGAALLLLAALRGWVWLALPLALVSSFEVARVPLYGSVWQSPAATGLGAFGPAYGELTSAFPYWTVAVGLIVLCVRRGPSLRGGRPLRARSWWWLAVLLVGVLAQRPNPRWPMLSLPGSSLVLGTPFVLGSPMALGRILTGTALVVAAIGAASVRGDLRWLLAAVIYRLPADAAAAFQANRLAMLTLVYRATFILAAAGAVALSRRSLRRDRLLR